MLQIFTRNIKVHRQQETQKYSDNVVRILRSDALRFTEFSLGTANIHTLTPHPLHAERIDDYIVPPTHGFDAGIVSALAMGFDGLKQ